MHVNGGWRSHGTINLFLNDFLSELFLEVCWTIQLHKNLFQWEMMQTLSLVQWAYNSANVIWLKICVQVHQVMLISVNEHPMSLYDKLWIHWITAGIFSNSMQGCIPGYPFATAIVKISKQDVQLSSISGMYKGIHKYISSWFYRFWWKGMCQL